MRLTLEDYEARGLTVDPDDVVVVKCAVASPVVLARVQELAQLVFPGNRVVAVGNGGSLVEVVAAVEGGRGNLILGPEAAQ